MFCGSVLRRSFYICRELEDEETQTGRRQFHGVRYISCWQLVFSITSAERLHRLTGAPVE